MNKPAGGQMNIILAITILFLFTVGYMSNLLYLTKKSYLPAKEESIKEPIEEIIKEPIGEYISCRWTSYATMNSNGGLESGKVSSWTKFTDEDILEKRPNEWKINNVWVPKEDIIIYYDYLPYLSDKKKIEKRKGGLWERFVRIQVARIITPCGWIWRTSAYCAAISSPH